MSSPARKIKESAVSADKLFAAADYIGRNDDGTRVAGFVSHWYGTRAQLVHGFVCFEERDDGEIVPTWHSTGQYRATPETLDELAGELGLERNQNKSGDVNLGALYEQEIGANTDLYALLNEIKMQLFVAHNDATDIAYTVLVGWDDIRGDSVYGKLYDIMLMREHLASIDAELSALQSQLVEAIDEK